MGWEDGESEGKVEGTGVVIAVGAVVGVFVGKSVGETEGMTVGGVVGGAVGANIMFVSTKLTPRHSTNGIQFMLRSQHSFLVENISLSLIQSGFSSVLQLLDGKSTK